ncbi:MAG: phosphatidylserine decarboxylase family protein [Bacteroidales bacterium]|nr:phosphatidylserine decarboxylase family protein [Bacteroidales bacterium]
MGIHREGYRILIFGFVILALVNVAFGLLLPGRIVLHSAAVVITVAIFIFLLFFFRLPKRHLDPDPELVYAPADGKVVVVEETEEMEYFKDRRLQVSIFMSPLNMHSNRYPVSGKIKYVQYHPGNYLVAWHPKSSELNERSTVVIETESGMEILIRQVAGAVARRIITYAKELQDVRQGDELGFIKFGSRVDIFLPVGTEIEIPLLRQVKANKSVLARL